MAEKQQRQKKRPPASRAAEVGGVRTPTPTPVNAPVEKRDARNKLSKLELTRRQSWKDKLKEILNKAEHEERQGKCPSSQEIASAASRWLQARGSSQVLTRDQVNHFRRIPPSDSHALRVPLTSDVANAFVWALASLGVWGNAPECVRSAEQHALITDLDPGFERIELSEETLKALQVTPARSFDWTRSALEHLAEIERLLAAPLARLSDGPKLDKDDFCRVFASALSQAVAKREMGEALSKGPSSSLLIYYPVGPFLLRRLNALPTELDGDGVSLPGQLVLAITGTIPPEQKQDLVDAVAKLQNAVQAKGPNFAAYWSETTQSMPCDLWMLVDPYGSAQPLGFIVVTIEKLRADIDKLWSNHLGALKDHIWDWTSLACPLRNDQVSRLVNDYLKFVFVGTILRPEVANDWKSLVVEIASEKTTTNQT